MRPNDAKRKGKGGAKGGDPEPGNASRAAAGETFEDSFARAEGAADALERGDLPLEEALRTYEDGVRGLKRCYEVLRGFEKRIEVLGSELGTVAEGAEGPVWIPAEASPGLAEAMEAVEREDDLPGPSEDGQR